MFLLILILVINFMSNYIPVEDVDDDAYVEKQEEQKK